MVRNEGRQMKIRPPRRLRDLIIACVVLIASPWVGAKQPVTELIIKYLEKDKEVRETLYELEGLRVNITCLDKKTLCQALAQRNEKPPLKQKTDEDSLYGNPAARHCLNLGGINRIGKDIGNNHYDLCLFKDGSLADSWLLYRKHEKLRKIPRSE